MRITRWLLVFCVALLAAPVPSMADEQKELDALVRRLMPEVAKIRGLAWKREVPAKILSKKELRERLVEMTDEDYPIEEQERDNRIVQALGLLPDGQKMLDVVRELMAEIVAGYYDPDAEQLFVIEGPVGAARIPTLVHELIHALDDQHYDLKALEEPFEDDADRQFALRCLFEGCAVHGQHLYAAVDPKSAAAEIQQSFDESDDDDGSVSALQTAPTWLIIDTLLHYRAGPYLVGRVAGSDYPGAMARLFKDPPTTQEQFLHPERWLDPARRDLPRTVEWKGDWTRVGYGWNIVHDTPIGELNLALFLNHFLDNDDGKMTQVEAATGRMVTDQSYDAAAGWDAGRSVVLDRPGGSLVLVHAFAFDSEADTKEAQAALETALMERNKERWKTPAAWRVVSQPSPDGKTHTTYHDGRGMGMIARRGITLFWIDGFARESTWSENEAAHGWQPLLAHTLATTFTQDPKDRGDDPAPDPYEGCALSVPRRGLGVRLPSDAWKAVALPTKTAMDPVARIALPKGAAIRVMVVEQGVAREAVPVILKLFVPNMDIDALTDHKVAGWNGYQYRVGRNAGQQMDLYAGSDGVRMIIAQVVGQPQILRLHAKEIEKIIGDLLSIPGY